MKKSSASSTSLLIARGLLLAGKTPALRPLLLEGSADLARRLLDEVESSWWFDFALEHSFSRRLLFGLERVALPGILLHWLARKRLIDSLAREALEAGCRQIVVLGAGLDTLAMRLHGDCSCFELDHPATQAIKRRAFADGPVLLPIDFIRGSVADELRGESQFRPDQPALFIAEGLLMYLPTSQVETLFSDLVQVSAPGSRFIFTFMEDRPGQPIGFQNSWRSVSWWLHWRSEPFCWALARSGVRAFAEENGWRLTALSAPEELRARFLAPHGLGGAPLAAGESVALATSLKK